MEDPCHVTLETIITSVKRRTPVTTTLENPTRTYLLSATHGKKETMILRRCKVREDLMHAGFFP
jgi:hypothetical protein